MFVTHFTRACEINLEHSGWPRGRIQTGQIVTLLIEGTPKSNLWILEIQ